MAQRDEEVALLPQEQQLPSRRYRSLQFAAGAILSILLTSAVLWTLAPNGDLVRSVANQEGPFIRRGRAPLNFLALGDWGRRGLYNQTDIAKQMGIVGEALDVDFIVSTGDNFYKDGLVGLTDIAFEESFTKVYTADSLQKPWHAVLGNHDYHGDVVSQLDPVLTLRDWRWNCMREGQIVYNLKTGLAQGGISSESASLELFFIDTVPFIDEYWQEGGKHQFDWRGLRPRKHHLKHKLKNLTKALKASTATWKIVVGHHTIRSHGNHGDSIELVQTILPTLEEHNVDVYLNGHDHCLEHVKREDSRIHFITSGGGSKAWKGISPSPNANGLQMYYDGQGFVSVSVAPTWIHISYYDINGKIIHEVEVSK